MRLVAQLFLQARRREGLSGLESGSRSGNGIQRAAYAAVVIVFLLVLMPCTGLGGATGAAPSIKILPAGEAYTGACTLLPNAIPLLTDGSNNDSFPFSPSPPGTPGTPEIVSQSSTGEGGPEKTAPNVTVGTIRSVWGRICETPAFVQPFQNLSPSNQSYRQFWYGAGWSGGAAGNVTIELGYLWDANCAGNTNWTLNASSSGPQPYVAQPLYPTPAYSGSGCTYWEYWSANVSRTGATNVSGPLLFEAVTSDFIVPITSPGGGLPGSGVLPFADIASLTIFAGMIILIVFAARRVRARSRATNGRTWPGGPTEALPQPASGGTIDPTRSSDPEPPTTPERLSGSPGSEPGKLVNDALNDLL
jgi:hypothetical protein